LLKDDLGLTHYEGTLWLGLHHFALLTMMAITYLQHRRLASHLQAGKKTVANAPGPPPQPSLPAVRRAILASLRPVICRRCPNCGALINIRQRE
jgi:SRSO17 transposase